MGLKRTSLPGAARKRDTRYPPASSSAVRRVMEANRARDTTPERVLRAALREVGCVGYRLNWDGAPGRPDIAFPGRRVAVFVHGCFWHHCQRCQQQLPKTHRAFWRAKFRTNRARDRRKRRELEAAGWVVLELPECVINKDVACAAASVRNVLLAASSPRQGTRARSREAP